MTRDKMKNKLFNLLLAVATILFNGFVLCLALFGLNYIIEYLFDIVLFIKLHHFNLDSYIYSVTIVTFIDAIDYNYNKLRKI